MFDNQVTRFGPGLNSSAVSGILSDLYVQERGGRVHEYLNDFDSYVAGDWTQTLNGGSVALTAGDGGLLALVTAVSASASIQDNPAAFTLTKTLRAWYQSQWQIDNVLGLVAMGLMNVTATPLTNASITDGAWFSSAAGGALSFNIAVGSVVTTVATGVTLAGATVYRTSWYYDGAVYAAGQPNGRIVWKVEQVTPATGIIVTLAQGEIGGGSATAMPGTFPGATNQAYTICASASTAAARTLTVDYVYYAKDRLNLNASLPA